MNVVVNGDPVEVAETANVGDIVTLVRPLPPGAGERARAGIAVALNGEVVPRQDWDTTRLAPQDRVEVLAPMQGGARWTIP